MVRSLASMAGPITVVLGMGSFLYAILAARSLNGAWIAGLYIGSLASGVLGFTCGIGIWNESKGKLVVGSSVVIMIAFLFRLLWTS